MLEQNDLNAIQDLLSQILLENNKHIDERFDAVDERFDAIDEKLIEMNHIDKIIFEEIDKVQNVLEKQIETVQKNLNEMNRYYRITKLENDNTTLLLKLNEELSKRVTELEKTV